MFCIIRIASSHRFQMYNVMDATDRMVQLCARSSRLRLGPSKMEEQWWTADKADRASEGVLERWLLCSDSSGDKQRVAPDLSFAVELKVFF